MFINLIIHMYIPSYARTCTHAFVYIPAHKLAFADLHTYACVHAHTQTQAHTRTFKQSWSGIKFEDYAGPIKF